MAARIFVTYPNGAREEYTDNSPWQTSFYAGKWDNDDHGLYRRFTNEELDALGMKISNARHANRSRSSCPGMESPIHAELDAIHGGILEVEYDRNSPYIGT